MRKILILFIIFLSFSSCSENTSNCENKVCTDMFATVRIKFLDSNGNPMVVKDYQAVNLRTNKLLRSTGEIDSVNAKGFYMVASDNNLSELAESENILVSAKHPITNALKEEEFIISGGECACHISNISGPDEIRF